MSAQTIACCRHIVKFFGVYFPVDLCYNIYCDYGYYCDNYYGYCGM